ncbi:anti-sigma factor antagonist [Mesobaculum littorinae]|uniref:Anti-sigma factor antagonist n=1 Tax=Mesobaculum littorinae TaxID=2486419 RepID=A0A438ADD0_9RHOB|nr:STAS domain-containing protein [Mesobaculum littorinae]RVV96688.1 anti-sigma factor antagonist [Mesobaculum littorinae]
MKLESKTRGEVMMVSIAEQRLDAAVTVDFKDAMRGLLNGAPARIVLDMSRVRFLDSSGLGAIISVRKSLDQTQELELAELTPAVEKVFHLTRMDTLFPIHASTQSAWEPRSRAS